MNRISWQLSLFPYELLKSCTKENKLIRGTTPFLKYFNTYKIVKNEIFTDTKTLDIF